MNLLYRYIRKSIDAFRFNHGAEIKSKIIYEIFHELGCEIEVVNWTKREYKPCKTYDVVFDIRYLNRLKDAFHENTIKILYLTCAYDSVRNEMMQKRVDECNRRMGSNLTQNREIADPHAIDESLEIADYVILNGNEVTLCTYPAKYHHKIHLADTIGMM